MAGFSQYQVRLSRDSFETPWGFRLQGGKDLGKPLSVQRVFTGSPAEGELQRGDLIVIINDRNAGDLLHKQAQDLIKFGGGSITLVIKRPPPSQVTFSSKTVTVIRPNPPHAPTFRSLPIQQSKQVTPTSHSPVKSPVRSFHPSSPQKQMPRHYGGGGPDFGADYSHVMPRAPNYGGGGPEFGADYHRQSSGSMLDRVQSSLDNAVGNYDPEGVITTPQYIPQHSSAKAFLYEPAAQYGGSQSTVYSPPSTFAPAPPMPTYVPQFQANPMQHQQQYSQEEEDYEIPSVSDRKKAFSQSEPRRVRARPGQRPASRPVYRPSDEAQDFGTDYRRPGAGRPQHQQQQQQPVYRPFSSPQHAQQSFQHSPQPRGGGGGADESGVVETSMAPAWRGTLKSSGPRPWNAEAMGELPPQQVSPHKASPAQRSHRPAQKSHAPPPPPQQNNPVPIYGQIGGQEGPQVVHLQYNSPIGMYSDANVKETLTGQTIGVNKPTPNPQQQGDGPRDWSQSAVFRMIQSDEKGQGGGQAAPKPAPKPAPSAGYNRPQIEDEVGISDF